MMIETLRKGDWGCTVTGRAFYPEDPRTEDICIEDIAHALSMMCRFGGHTREFYSVGQHSVLVSDVCHPRDALWGLLHDASEAYIVDIPRPLKYAEGMEGYRVLESAFMTAVCERFGLPRRMPETVSWADEALLATEARDLMPQDSVEKWSLNELPLDRRIEPWTPRYAKEQFLSRFYSLTEGV